MAASRGQQCVLSVCAVTLSSRLALLQMAQHVGGMNVSATKRLRQLEAENARLKRIDGEQPIDIVALMVGKGK